MTIDNTNYEKIRYEGLRNYVSMFAFIFLYLTILFKDNKLIFWIGLVLFLLNCYGAYYYNEKVKEEESKTTPSGTPSGTPSITTPGTPSGTTTGTTTGTR